MLLRHASVLLCLCNPESRRRSNYVGLAHDLRSLIGDHQSGRVQSTKSRRPVRVALLRGMPELARCRGAREVFEERMGRYLPSDAIGNYTTKHGLDSLRDHEGRRIKVVQNGFKTYLEPAELTGAATTKCGEVRSKTAGEAQRSLLTFPKQYWRYNLTEQKEITKENDPGNKNTIGALFDGFIITHAPAATDSLATPDCPNGGCN